LLVPGSYHLCFSICPCFLRWCSIVRLDDPRIIIDPLSRHNTTIFFS
jgi:hypothetical protein